ncbi:MAG: hypothetical protein ACXAC5_02720 [Promethearchaeota archaeon]|jgi:hypothetical protein
MERPSMLLWSNHHDDCYYGTLEEAIEMFYLIDIIEMSNADKESSEENHATDA